MTDLVLPDFPDSLLERVDAYIKLLEDLNPGKTWSRTSAVSTLLVRALAEAEGTELRLNRRSGGDRRDRGRGPERRQGPDERRTVAYPEMIDLVIEEILKTKVDPGLESSDTWRGHRNVDDI